MNAAGLCVLILAAVVTTEAQRCPNDWVHFENSCYAFLDEVVPWTTAEAYCRILHARMLEVESKAENDFIAAQIRSRSEIRAVWQGVNDLVREGRWVFNSNNQEPTFFNWRSGQPDNSHHTENGEDCIQIYSDGTWDDLWCETHVSGFNPSPVCETDTYEEEIIG